MVVAFTTTRPKGGDRAMWYIYVLQSAKNSRHYTGLTDDLKRRILAHNSGKVSSTSSRKPFSLIYYEACQNKEKAIRREKYLKTGYGRKFLKNRI